MSEREASRASGSQRAGQEPSLATATQRADGWREAPGGGAARSGQGEWPLEVALDQAPEGCGRRAEGKALRAARPPDRGRGPLGRR